MRNIGELVDAIKNKQGMAVLFESDPPVGCGILNDLDKVSSVKWHGGEDVSGWCPDIEGFKGLIMRNPDPYQEEHVLLSCTDCFYDDFPFKEVSKEEFLILAGMFCPKKEEMNPLVKELVEGVADLIKGSDEDVMIQIDGDGPHSPSEVFAALKDSCGSVRFLSGTAISSLDYCAFDQMTNRIPDGRTAKYLIIAKEDNYRLSFGDDITFCECEAMRKICDIITPSPDDPNNLKDMFRIPNLVGLEEFVSFCSTHLPAPKVTPPHRDMFIVDLRMYSNDQKNGFMQELEESSSVRWDGADEPPTGFIRAIPEGWKRTESYQMMFLMYNANCDGALSLSTFSDINELMLQHRPLVDTITTVDFPRFVKAVSDKEPVT